MKVRVDKSIASWSEGPSLLEFLDAMPVTDRKVNAPFMMPVSEKYAEMGAIVVGKIESGRVKSGDKLLLMPNKVSSNGIRKLLHLVDWLVDLCTFSRLKLLSPTSLTNKVKTSNKLCVVTTFAYVFAESATRMSALVLC